MGFSKFIFELWDKLHQRETVKDTRLHPNPGLKRYKSGGRFVLDLGVMTPLRLSFLHEIIFFPMIVVGTVAIAITAIDAALNAVGIRFLFAELSFSRFEFLAALLGLWLLWLTEAFFRYPIFRFIFGRRIAITIYPHFVHVLAGLKSHSFSRDQNIAFSQVPFVHSTSLAYRNSQALYLIVAETRRVRLAEVFDLQLLEQLVNNANVALFLSQQQNDLDIDPMKQHRPDWNELDLPYILPPSYPPIESTAVEVGPEHVEQTVAELKPEHEIRQTIRPKLRLRDES